MIIEKKEIKGVIIYTVDKDITDEQTMELKGSFCAKPKFIIRQNSDVYTKEGSLLLRFRKNVLPKSHIDVAYKNIIDFAMNKTSTRGTTSGTEKGKRGDPGQTNKTMSNIMGYFDKWTLKQKSMFKHLCMKAPFKVRVCAFNANNPEKWQKVIPLIKDIDRQYKKLVPKHHAKQLTLANQTAYRIPGTAFTTVTTNVNFQTACHKDAGDYTDGFGNLVVIERGKYTGGYTVFPQYGVGVDVRSGDFLAMDVHQMHGNTAIVPATEGAIRLSLVCYLRENVYLKSKGTTEAHIERNLKVMDRLKAKAKELAKEKDVKKR